MKQSLWLTDIHLPEFPELEGELKTDVLIIGGGLAGILCAYELRQQGIDYALIEADRVFRHMSGNTTAKLTSQHGLIYGELLKTQGSEAASQYWKANETALSKLRALCIEKNCDFVEEPNYIYSSFITPTVRQAFILIISIKSTLRKWVLTPAFRYTTIPVSLRCGIIYQ